MSMSKSDRRSQKTKRSGLPKSIDIYDTTLRDGSQLEGISLTVNDKLRIAAQLDYLGVAYIEGGWPGSNPKDDEFFQRAQTELELKTSQLVVFGSTRKPKPKGNPAVDMEPLISANTDVVCIVGKSWDYHVTEALRTSLEEGVDMVRDSIRYLKDQGKKAFFDAEHFFDGYKANPDYALEVLAAADEAGADCLVLCDTNGGSLPDEVRAITEAVVRDVSAPVGVHLHNDTDCGVANALAGVQGGASQVQGTINGYGERTGNCNIVSVIANLELKLGVKTLPKGHLDRMFSVSHHVAELVNIVPHSRQPFVGLSAFAHKAGLHTSALSRRSDAYEHIDPVVLGNKTRYLVSEMSGRSSVVLKAKELGIDLGDETVSEVVDTLKKLEYEGYHFEVADASLELLMRGASGWRQPYFELETFSVSVTHKSGNGSKAWNESSVDMESNVQVSLKINGENVEAAGQGNGPVDALHSALKNALSNRYPAFDTIQLTDYKVRVLDTKAATGALTRVLIESTNGTDVWNTIGVSGNIVEASWQALVDSIVWGFLHDPQGDPTAPRE